MFDLFVTRSFLSVLLLFSVAAVSVLALFSRDELQLYFRHFLLACYQHRTLVGILVFAIALSFMSGANEPAHAMFLSNAENYAKQTFPQAQKFLPLIFGALRLIFILIVVAGIILLAARAGSGQEWQSIAQTFALVIVILAAGDAIVEAVLNGGSGGTP